MDLLALQPSHRPPVSAAQRLGALGLALDGIGRIVGRPVCGAAGCVKELAPKHFGQGLHREEQEIAAARPCPAPRKCTRGRRGCRCARASSGTAGAPRERPTFQARHRR